MKGLEAAAHEWEESLANCTFIGELALSEKETLQYSSELSKMLKSSSGFIYKDLAMAVLAVNCAYYTYDDDGFWKHFCKYINCTGINEMEIGSHIERFFQKFEGDDFIPRTGPYRYVGRILEHCGISRYYLFSFANFIRTLKINQSYRNISNLEYQKYKKMVPDNINKYLREFLQDESGWGFVISVASAMDHYVNGHISLATLCTLQGFRHDFWPNFLECLDGRPVNINLDLLRGPITEPNFRAVQPPSLYWADANPRLMKYAAVEHVYTPPFRKIGISNPAPLEKGQYILLCSVNGEVSRIKPDMLERDERGRVLFDMNTAGFPVPCHLELWFEPLGRIHGPRTIGAWNMSLVDDLAISTYPTKLNRPEDFTSISLEAPDRYGLEFPPPALNLDNARRWSVSCDHRLASGNLSTPAFHIPVEVPVYRDAIRLQSGGNILFNNEIFADEWLMVEGIPGSKINFLIQNGNEYQDIQTGAHIGSDGTATLNIKNCLSCSLQKWKKSWGLLNQGSGTIKGALLYINLADIVLDLQHLDQYPDEFFGALPGECAGLLKHLAYLSTKGTPSSFDAEKIFAFPQKFQPLVWVLAACKKFLDGADIRNLGRHMDQVPPDTIQTLSWYEKARTAQETDRLESLEDLLGHAMDTDAVYAQGWKDKILQQRERLENLISLRTDLPRLIREWVSLVTNPHQEYRGIIAETQYGRDLTDAWRDFCRRKKSGAIAEGVYTQIYQKAEGVYNKSATGVVGALAHILMLLVLARSGRKDLLPNIDPGSFPEKLRPEVNFLLYEEDLDDNSLLSSLIL